MDRMEQEGLNGLCPRCFIALAPAPENLEGVFPGLRAERLVEADAGRLVYAGRKDDRRVLLRLLSVEDDLVGIHVIVIAGENAVENVALLFLGEEHKEFILRPHSGQAGVEHRAEWACHPSMYARVLTQNP